LFGGTDPHCGIQHLWLNDGREVLFALIAPVLQNTGYHIFVPQFSRQI
jgi:hypothetical protein